jgi:hypothetical protein
MKIVYAYNKWLSIFSRRSAWLLNMGLSHSDKRKELKCCQHHFEETDYNNQMKLKKESVPRANKQRLLVRFTVTFICHFCNCSLCRLRLLTVGTSITEKWTFLARALIRRTLLRAPLLMSVRQLGVYKFSTTNIIGRLFWTFDENIIIYFRRSPLTQLFGSPALSPIGHQSPNKTVAADCSDVLSSRSSPVISRWALCK